MPSLAISQLIAPKKWKEVDLGQFMTGADLAKFMESCDGHDFVAEWENDGEKGYLCGMQQWASVYENRGFKVFSFRQATPVLLQRGHLDRIVEGCRHPTIQKAQEVFGSPVSRVELLENREERVAIMKTEGMSAEEAHAYCDSKPELYGKTTSKGETR